jgi:hypothetical protein
MRGVVYDFRMRSRVGTAACAALLIAVATLAGGCPAPGYRPDRGSRFERVLVLPLNLVAAMPRELAGRARRVDRVLLEYLSERGKAVETIGFADALAAWRAADSDCRSQGNKGCDRFARVAAFAARRLRADHDYDVLIVPYLLLRGARTNGEMASFDGVKRPVEKAGFVPEGPNWVGSGRIRAASLKVFGFSPDGERVFAGIGGLDLVDRIVASDQRGPYTIEVREDALGDPENIREGVVLALDRLVPRIDDEPRRKKS